MKGAEMFTLRRRIADAEEATERGRLQLPQGAGRAECQVVDPVGLPMQASVTVLDQAGQAVTQGLTDAYGFYTAAVPPGDYQLSVRSDGFEPRRVFISVLVGRTTSTGVIRLVAAALPPTPSPGHWTIDPDHTAIRFVARHLGMADIHGRFNRFFGNLWITERMRDSQVDLFIEARSIDTGVRRRDSHLRSRDFLDVENHPYLTFNGGNFVHRGGSRWDVTGVLELNGVARTVNLDTTYLGVGTGMAGESRAVCKAVTELHREDFTLTWQRMLPRSIAAIGTTIRVELDIQVVRAAQVHSLPAVR
jgi:polyisoprenoid-binding protein YceI